MNKHKKKIRRGKTLKTTNESPFKFYWGKENVYFLIGGFAVLILGFYLMSVGKFDSFTSLNLSTIVLLIAYVVVFPLAIFYRKKNKSETNDTSKS